MKRAYYLIMGAAFAALCGLSAGWAATGPEKVWEAVLSVLCAIAAALCVKCALDER